MTNSVSPATDAAFCRALLPRVSRTFALSIEALPQSLRRAVRATYLLCRVVDTIEDDATIAPEARAALFDAFDALLADDARDPAPFEALCEEVGLGGESGAERALCQGAGAAFRVFRALPAARRASVRGPLGEMSAGMREYTVRADAAGALRLDDLDDLERYCYFVAGTVGEMLTGLFVQELPGLDPDTRRQIDARAVSFGVGLQLVNIVKDVATDFDRGDCFLPQSLADEHRVALERLLDPEQRDAALQMVGAICARAREHLARAREYVALWPPAAGKAVRLFCTVPLALAYATLLEVESGSDTLKRERTPKLRRDAVFRIQSEVSRAVDNNQHLERLLTRYTH